MPDSPKVRDQTKRETLVYAVRERVCLSDVTVQVNSVYGNELYFEYPNNI